MAPKLVWQNAAQQTHEFTIEQDCVVIGRAASNHLQFPNRAVSQHHARFIRLLNDVFLEDLDSTNGTYVNQAPVKKRVLRHGDRITIGRELLHFMCPVTQRGALEERTAVPPKPQAAAMPPDRVQAATSKPATPASAASATVVQADSPAAPLGSLWVESGTQAGTTIPLQRGVTTLGNPGEAVVAISKRGSQFFAMLIDTGNSRQVPTLNGSPLRAQGKALQDGDLITTGNANMRFHQSA